MGLDMYLYANKYDAKHTYGWEDEKRERTAKSFYPRALQKLALMHSKENFLSKETFYQIGYWRKFNALHSFIVDNYSTNGEDDCRKIYLSLENLQEILDTLKKVKANPGNAEDILPPRAGFFFGSTQIDEWYMRDIEYSIELFEEVIATVKRNDKRKNYYEIYYQASW